MLRIVGFLACCFLALASEPVQEVRFIGELAPTRILPTFDNGHIVVYESGGIAVYSPQGILSFRVYDHAIFNAAVNKNGTTVVLAVQAGGLAVLGQTGAKKNSIDTGRYQPSDICFAPDGTLWTIGWEDRQRTDILGDYLILRKFSLDGRQLGSFMPRSGFNSVEEPARPTQGGWRVRVANNRIGVNLSNPINLWIELDLSGKEIGRWPLGDRLPAAFTSSGTIYARGLDGVSILDRMTGAWRPISAPASGKLIGADGDKLVFMNGNVLTWVSESK